MTLLRTEGSLCRQRTRRGWSPSEGTSASACSRSCRFWLDRWSDELKHDWWRGVHASFKRNGRGTSAAFELADALGWCEPERDTYDVPLTALLRETLEIERELLLESLAEQRSAAKVLESPRGVYPGYWSLGCTRDESIQQCRTIIDGKLEQLAVVNALL
jgi:hypothetical protein